MNKSFAIKEDALAALQDWWSMKLAGCELTSEQKAEIKLRADLFDMWRKKGVSTRGANILANILCRNRKEIRAKGIMFFLGLDNCGWKTTREFGALIGRDWSRHGKDWQKNKHLPLGTVRQ